MQIDHADIRASFDSTTLERGLEYFNRRRVVGVRDDGSVVQAEVVGSRRAPYHVKLRMQERLSRKIIVGECSCPVGMRCKHAAAVALAIIYGGRSEPQRDAADGAVDSWAQTFAALQTCVAPRASRENVHYVIDVTERYYVPHFELSAYVVPMLQNGSPGTSRRFDLYNLATGNARRTTPVDRTIGRLVNASGLLGGLGNVSPVILGTLLELMIDTGRLHWRSMTQAPLERRALADARIAWRLGEDDRQRPQLDGLPASVLIPSSPLWYVDTLARSAGPARVGATPELAAHVATVPALTAEQAKRTQIFLRGAFSGSGIELPKAAIEEHVIDRDPIPVLRLSGSSPTAELQFAYGDRLVYPGQDDRALHVYEGETAAIWPRRIAFESGVRARMEELDFVPAGWPQQFEGRGRFLLRPRADGDLAWLRFLDAAMPQLRQGGWRIEIDDSFPFEVEQADREWQADLHETELSWFEFDLGIDLHGERVALLPIIIAAIAAEGIGPGSDLAELSQRAEPVYGKLPNGKYLALPAARVSRVLAALVDLFGRDALTEEGRLPIARVQAGTLANLDGAVQLGGAAADSLHRLLDELSSLDGTSFQTPATFKSELRPYQRDGVAWLGVLRKHGFGGVLADDMGLGKTVQLLAHVAAEKSAQRLRRPVLIVAPTSVVPNWRAEIARFVPKLRVVALTGPDRAQRVDQIEGADIVLSTYALLPRDAEHLLEREWSIAVLDEAQAVKNPRAKAAAAARALRAGQRIAMTGTPIENHLEELWSIYAFAVPGLLGERTAFARLFRTPIEKRGDTLRRASLAARLRPFLLRRTKERVAADLPEKTEIVQRIELAGAQRDLYETIRLAMHKRVRDEVARRGLARSRIVVLDALLKLRQVCCDPRLVRLPAAEGVKESQKLDALLDMLDSLLEDGRRVLLFSQFTSMLDLMKPELSKRQMRFVELRGDTRDRQVPVQRFQSKEVPLFLISLRAGGTGLNLTAADTVIHYDPWWNPAVQRQATDRAHRIGQSNHVFVYKLIAEGTVEERILELQERKGALASSLFEETSTAPLRLDIDEIDRLFSAPVVSL